MEGTKFRLNYLLKDHKLREQDLGYPHAMVTKLQHANLVALILGNKTECQPIEVMNSPHHPTNPQRKKGGGGGSG